jgi:hypothetical protein
LTEELFGSVEGGLAPRNAGDGWHTFVLEDGKGFVGEEFDVRGFGDVEGEKGGAFHFTGEERSFAIIAGASAEM